jgi:hypothetical protein
MNLPPLSALISVTIPVSLFVNLTRAAGATAPDWSSTLPLKVAGADSPAAVPHTNTK